MQAASATCAAATCRSARLTVRSASRICTWYSFSGKGEHFARPTSGSGTGRRSLATIRETLQRTAERLAAVSIEERDFAEILRRYDTPETFFYLDPPYVEFQHNARYQALTTERRAELFGLVSTVRGKCLLSFDDHAEIRDLAKQHGLQTRRAMVRYTITGNHHAKNASELLIANFSTSAE
jgi:DNA adenine methylase